jgi:uncharacterized RDD family membrane protein YckC
MKQKEYASYELAGLGTRFIALFIDGCIIGVIGGIIFSILRDPGGIVSFILYVGYNWYFWTRKNGQTPGKSLMKIRVIKKNGMPIQDADAIVRAVGYYFSGIVFGLGFFWAFWDEDRQTWHDKLASTYVVKVNSEIVA